MNSLSSGQAVTVLDGGMGRELMRIGAPFRQPEWSALALMEGPEWVTRAHQNFVDAGAQVITTNSYACVPFHLGEARFWRAGASLAALSGSLARQVADANPGVSVAGSIPPVFGSYRPDLYDADRAASLVGELVSSLVSFVDRWLVETTSSIVEATTAFATIASIGDPVAYRPRWVSFTLLDELTERTDARRSGDSSNGVARLRSGESIAAACAAIAEQADAILFNCSQPEVMLAAVREARAALPSIAIGVYANAFPAMSDDAEANESLASIRTDLSPARYTEFAREWVAAGASIIGGCCGITPDHIHAIGTL